MSDPKISVLLCTVRPSRGAYREQPDQHVIGKVLSDLAVQTFKDFELIVVDGLHAQRREEVPALASAVTFPVVHVPPRETVWTKARKVAISTYRNTGIAHARGALIVNLDDCCVLPELYLEVFWRAWNEHGVCAAMTWPHLVGEQRRPGRVTAAGRVYGFGSYPLEVALELNGYDEAYDGGQGLEDVDWSTRLFLAGLPQALVQIPGFDIAPQSGHDGGAIDLAEPIVKCCNAAWQTQRVWRSVRVANRPELWTGPQGREALERLIGPCQYLVYGEMCGHHNGQMRCAYYEQFARVRHPIAARVLANTPVVDLRREHADNITVGRTTVRPTVNKVVIKRGVTFDAATSEPGVLAEVFDEDCYLLDAIPEGARVLDIGANFGAFALAAAVVRKAKVLAVEPNPEMVTWLRHNGALNDLCCGALRVLDVAVGCTEEKRTLYVDCDGPWASSIYAQSASKHFEVDAVPLWKLLNIMMTPTAEESPIGPFVVKIDCEGAEREIFDPLSLETLSNHIETIMLEWHNYDGLLYKTILEANGFEVRLTGCNTPDWKSSYTRGMLYATNKW